MQFLIRCPITGDVVRIETKAKPSIVGEVPPTLVHLYLEQSVPEGNTRSAERAIWTHPLLESLEEDDWYEALELSVRDSDASRSAVVEIDITIREGNKEKDAIAGVEDIYEVTSGDDCSGRAFFAADPKAFIAEFFSASEP